MRNRLRVLGILAVLSAMVPGIAWLQTAPLEREQASIIAAPPWPRLPDWLLEEPVAMPVRLQIPAIRVDASVERVGLDDAGAMANPSSWHTVGWYEPGPRPGEHGNAVFAGHLDSTTGPAVFWRLRSLATGDELLLIDDLGNTRRFTVTETREFSAAEPPLQDIFAMDGPPRVVLVTCAGAWANGGYQERYVVFADETARSSTSSVYTIKRRS